MSKQNRTGVYSVVVVVVIGVCVCVCLCLCAICVSVLGGLCMYKLSDTTNTCTEPHLGDVTSRQQIGWGFIFNSSWMERVYVWSSINFLTHWR